MIHVAGKYSLVRPIAEVAKIDGTRWPAHTYHPHTDTTDVYALTYAVTKIQEVAMAERFLIQSYGRVMNGIQCSGDGTERWVRVK